MPSGSIVAHPSTFHFHLTSTSSHTMRIKTTTTITIPITPTTILELDQYQYYNIENFRPLPIVIVDMVFQSRSDCESNCRHSHISVTPVRRNLDIISFLLFHTRLCPFHYLCMVYDIGNHLIESHQRSLSHLDTETISQLAVRIIVVGRNSSLPSCTRKMSSAHSWSDVQSFSPSFRGSEYYRRVNPTSSCERYIGGRILTDTRCNTKIMTPTTATAVLSAILLLTEAPCLLALSPLRISNDISGPPDLPATGDDKNTIMSDTNNKPQNDKLKNRRGAISNHHRRARARLAPSP